jgi:sulfatase maturation enzyme AslB (radical SAM superfamily)
MNQSAPNELRVRKFVDPDVTADGKARASVPLDALRTLWFNTGTLCNLTCTNCYIESSPPNDRLVYLTRAHVTPYLDQIERLSLPTQEIGFTGGEPCGAKARRRRRWCCARCCRTTRASISVPTSTGRGPIKLNHPHGAKFCVLGGCSG